jgi:hypothetical protein
MTMPCGDSRRDEPTVRESYALEDLTRMARQPRDRELHERLTTAIHDTFGSMRTTHVTEYAAELSILLQEVHTTYVDELLDVVTDAGRAAGL